MSDLRERVARACAYAVEKQHSDLQAVKALGFESVEAFVDKAWPNYLPQADAAIALVAKESAAEVERLRAALRPFAWYAENLVPQIDKICGEGFYKSLEEARAALEGK